MVKPRPQSENRVWERLIQPHPAVSDPERRSAVRTLSAFMLGLSIFALLLGIAYFLLFDAFLIEIRLAIAVYFLVYLLSRSPRPTLGEFVFVIGLTGVILLLLVNRGASAHYLIWAVAPILVGAILLPMWAAILFSLVNIGIPASMALSSSQLDPEATFSLVTMLIFTATVALAIKHVRQRDQEKLEQQALALARSRARYKELFDDVPIGLFETTREGKILQANQALLDMLGYPDREAVKSITTSESYVNPADRERLKSLLQEKGTVQDFETQLIGADGRRIWVRENVRAVRDHQNNTVHYRGSMQDITEHRQLQRELAQQHQTLQMIIGAMPNVLLVVDEQNRLTALYMPPDFPPLLKQEWATSMDKLAEVLPPELADETLSSMETVRETGGGRSFERAVWSAEEEMSRYLRVQLSSVTETGDMLIVVDDVTKLKQAEEAARAYAAELELRNAELDAFSHTVAHNLRTPLTQIVGYADIIRHSPEDELSPQTSEFLMRIEDAAFKISEMIEALLMLAHLRDTEEVVESVDVSATIEAAVKRLQAPIEERGVQVDVVQPVPDALGYGPWLEEAFANLIDNAVKYMGQSNTEPTITIRAVDRADTVRYEVEDNGLGISPQDREKLFELLSRFHQDEAGGTGLGLSIVQRIVDKLGGTVGVDSESGEGSTFWFTLPALSEEAAASNHS